MWQEEWGAECFSLSHFAVTQKQLLLGRNDKGGMFKALTISGSRGVVELGRTALNSLSHHHPEGLNIRSERLCIWGTGDDEGEGTRF